ncbi:hypothetical protein AVEN_225383-1 [Araneus ventricosus]|uniref:Uncharacterized protein n=1 Tax=Araneus ventricosus TaxID=182803 RepID=A0A4Y2Q5L4_ARAVE|nr:hypothetical protein AVEN_225383-1 [Araneus ventricosus]
MVHLTLRNGYVPAVRSRFITAVFNKPFSHNFWCRFAVSYDKDYASSEKVPSTSALWLVHCIPSLHMPVSCQLFPRLRIRPSFNIRHRIPNAGFLREKCSYPIQRHLPFEEGGFDSGTLCDSDSRLRPS